MKKNIIVTADGSHSIQIPEMNVTYHSVHGAIQESKHVFIDAGLLSSGLVKGADSVNILEVGFGTGLNLLLTAIEAERINKSMYYVGIEPFPLNMEQVRSLNYCTLLKRLDLKTDFLWAHEFDPNKTIAFTEDILFHKSNATLEAFDHTTDFDLVYFDAFAPAAQPELWTKEVFAKLYSLLNDKGILVTYCSKGEVRRNMQEAGFIVEKLPGPKGKREIVRARR